MFANFVFLQQTFSFFLNIIIINFLNLKYLLYKEFEHDFSAFSLVHFFRNFSIPLFSYLCL